MPEPIQIRKLAEMGVYKDVSPHELPLNAFSDANNVQFRNGKARRSQTWRRVFHSLGFEPMMCRSIRLAGIDYIILGGSNGDLRYYSNGSVSGVGSLDGGTATSPWTTSILGFRFYANRAEGVPKVFDNSALTWATLTNWDSTHRCKALRPYAGALMAINMSKGAADFETMVKASDIIPQVGDVPQSWDHNNPTTNATEISITEAQSGLVDGLILGTDFIVYSEDQVFRIRATQDQFVYDTDPLYDEGGLISQNCVAEVAGVHYCFGQKDFYRHDGQQKFSVGKDRNRNYVWSTMNFDLRQRCFARHDLLTNSIIFGYVSNDGAATAYSNPSLGCNKAAVYNIDDDNMHFIDLPNVVDMNEGNVDQSLTWSTIQGTWDSFGGTWASIQDSSFRHLVAVSGIDGPNGFTASKLLSYDYVDVNTVVPFELESEMQSKAWIEKRGIDFDAGVDIDRGVPLRTHKEIGDFIPQISVSRPMNVNIRLGAQDVPTGEPVWDAYQSFDPEVDTHINSRREGRYLAFRMEFPDVGHFELTGIDLEPQLNGGR